MKTTEQKRRQLIDDVRGRKKLNIYQLREFGGFGLIVTPETYTEKQLRETALDSRNKHKKSKVSFAKDYPTLAKDRIWNDEEMEILTFEERLAMANEVREELEPKDEPLPIWVTDTLRESETETNDEARAKREK